jgi:hypothetical protein
MVISGDLETLNVENFPTHNCENVPGFPHGFLSIIKSEMCGKRYLVSVFQKAIHLFAEGVINAFNISLVLQCWTSRALPGHNGGFSSDSSPQSFIVSQILVWLTHFPFPQWNSPDEQYLVVRFWVGPAKETLSVLLKKKMCFDSSLHTNYFDCESKRCNWACERVLWVISTGFDNINRGNLKFINI